MINTQDLVYFTPFNALSEDYLAQVLDHAETLEVAKGKLVFKRGKTASHRYYLLKGAVDLVNSDFMVEHFSHDQSRSALPLTDTSPTQVSAVAKADCVLLKVEAEFLDIAMAWCESGHIEEEEEPVDFQTHMPSQRLEHHTIQVEESDSGDWMSSLLQSPLFTKVPPANIQQLFGRFEAQECQPGEIVIKEGLPGEYFYVIERGQARVHNKSGSINVTLGPGSYFGEEALVGDTMRNATVTMTSAGMLMKLGKEDFLTLLQEPILKHVTIESLAQLQDQNHIVLLDVRLPLEYRFQHVPKSRNIPLGALRNRLSECSADMTYVITDDGGRRSQVAVHLLCQSGFDACLLESSANCYVDD